MKTTCPECDGTGTFDPHTPCEWCKGSGAIVVFAHQEADGTFSIYAQPWRSDATEVEE